MMKILYSVMAFWLLIQNSHAQVDNLYINASVGHSDLTLDEVHSFSGKTEAINGIEVRIGAHYRFESNILLNANTSLSASHDLFQASDSYDVFQITAFVGYIIKPHPRLEIVPKVGVSRWILSSKEGRFLNPGPEATEKLDSVDGIWSISFHMPAKPYLKFDVSFTELDAEFGRHKASHIGVELRL